MRKESNVYIINKTFSILRRNRDVGIAKQLRICTHLRNHLLLKNYFSKLLSFKKQSLLTKLVILHRRKHLFLTWKKIHRLVKLNSQKLKMIKVYLTKKKKYRMLPLYFKVLH